MTEHEHWSSEKVPYYLSEQNRFSVIKNCEIRKVDYAQFLHGSNVEERLFLLLEHYKLVVPCWFIETHLQEPRVVSKVD